MQASEHAPQQVSYHDIIFVSIPTFVCVEVDVLLAEPMYFKEVMEHAYHCVSALTHVNCLINEVVDLAWYGFAAHSRDGALPWGEEVHGTRLEGVVRVEHLLDHVERVVCHYFTRAWFCFLSRWWWAEFPRRGKQLVHRLLSCIQGVYRGSAPLSPLAGAI